MRNTLFSLSILCLLLLFACSDSSAPAEASAASAQNQKSDVPTSAAEEVLKQSFEGKSPEELAEAGCQCFEALYQMRTNAKKEYDAGDQNAFSRVDKDLLEERSKAKPCVRAVVKPLIGDESNIAKFEQALIKKCPHSYSNILLLSRIKFQSEE